MSALTRIARSVVAGRWSRAIDPVLRRAAMRSTALLGVGRERSSSPAQAALTAMDAVGHPLLLGHRGAMARAPENTLGAFAAALADGAHGVELDVTLSGDSVPIVLHDDTLDRTTNAAGKPSDFDADELASLDAASWFPGGWPHREGVPRLAEVLERMPDGAVVNVELKGPSPAWVGLERRVLEVVEAHRRRLHVVVSSFHPAQLLEVRRLDATVPIGVLLWPRSLLPLRTGLAVPLLRADAVHPPASLVDAAFMSAARASGLRVHVWSVKDVVEAERLLALGVDALIVDDVASHASHFPSSGRAGLSGS
jgi:glycerophosphoryl diester phosphodiesterase